MERIQVTAMPRTVASKGHLKQLRDAGQVPGIVYGQNEDPANVAVDAKDIIRILQAAGGANTLVELTLGDKNATVMIKALERDILLPDRFTHVDLLRISLKDKLDVQVPVILTGDAAGLGEGGVVQQVLREVSLKCLPTDIPESIELDISALQLGESLSVADLRIPSGSELLTDPAEAVVTIAAPRAAEDAEATEAADEAEAPGANADEADNEE